ncbi:MAG: hypothetical protein OER04_00270 [Cyclobacteriaceae bacterium]|nr:hypothetical protein [Cyclobacteriaceae bacterium]
MEIKTDKLLWKKSILQSAKEKQQAIVNDFRLRIENILKAEKGISEEGMDLDRQARDDYGKLEVNLLADQLNFAVEEMNLLNKISIEKPLHNQVQFGSVVVTDQEKVFFVSVSLEEFKVDGKEVFGMSTKAPIYQDLKGKITGDSFGNQTITDLF